MMKEMEKQNLLLAPRPCFPHLIYYYKLILVFLTEGLIHAMERER